jgi:serine/threonine protein kinase
MVIIFNYNIGEKIGVGSFSSVYTATNSNTSVSVAPVKEYAIKVIKMNKISDHIKSKIKMEVEILSKLDHPNIIKLHESFYNDGLLYIVLDKCKTDLSTEIKTNGSKIDISTKMGWIDGLLNGLKYLHQNNIIHRDIKPQNTLLDNLGNIKIIDFGFARYFGAENLMNTICGSPLYMSPEIFISNTYDYKSDYWSMGVVLYHIIVGSMPYNAKNINDLILKLQTLTDIKIPSDIATKYPAELIDLVESMLIINTKHRLSYEKFQIHPYFIKKTAVSSLTKVSSLTEPIDDLIKKQNIPKISSISSLKDLYVDTSDNMCLDKFNKSNKSNKSDKCVILSDTSIDMSSDTSPTEAVAKNILNHRTDFIMDEDYIDDASDIPDLSESIASTDVFEDIDYVNIPSKTVSAPIPIPMARNLSSSGSSTNKLTNNLTNNSTNKSTNNSTNKYSKTLIDNDELYGTVNDSPIYKNYFSAPVYDDSINKMKSQFEYTSDTNNKKSSFKSTSFKSTSSIGSTTDKAIGMLNYSLDIIQEKIDTFINPK